MRPSSAHNDETYVLQTLLVNPGAPLQQGYDKARSDLKVSSLDMHGVGTNR